VREQRWVEVDGGRLWVEVAGEGDAVVLIHPGLWDMRAWDPQFDAFAERYRVVRYDVRGYGRSSRPEPGRAYSDVRDLVAVMDAAGAHDAAMIGCSLGGMIALDAVLTYPQRAWGLVMVASAPRGLERTPEEDAWGEDLTASVGAAVEAGEIERAMDLQLEVWASLGTDDPAGRGIREIAFGNLHTLTMDDSGAEEMRPTAAERLEEVAVPTLVLPADLDPPVLQRASRVLAERIPDARLVRIPVVDHVIGMRRPQDFNREVLAFLASIRS